MVELTFYNAWVSDNFIRNIGQEPAVRLDDFLFYAFRTKEEAFDFLCAVTKTEIEVISTKCWVK